MARVGEEAATHKMSWLRWVPGRQNGGYDNAVQAPEVRFVPVALP